VVRQFLSFGNVLCWHFETRPFLLSANERVRNRKRDNYTGNKSRVHLQILRENSIRRGYEAQTATQFFQSKT
jgi:hypothetical protein